MHYSRLITTGEVGPAESMRVLGDDEARFWSRVDMLGPVVPHKLTLGWCWQWTGPLDASGYGTFRADNVARGAHRWAYLNFVGPIAEGWQVDHLCHNRACVNFLLHLEAVPPRVNSERRLGVVPDFGWATLSVAQGTVPA